MSSCQRSSLTLTGSTLYFVKVRVSKALMTPSWDHGKKLVTVLRSNCVFLPSYISKQPSNPPNTIGSILALFNSPAFVDWTSKSPSLPGFWPLGHFGIPVGPPPLLGTRWVWSRGPRCGTDVPIDLDLNFFPYCKRILSSDLTHKCWWRKSGKKVKQGIKKRNKKCGKHMKSLNSSS